MNEKELAQKAIEMRRDYSDKEIAELLDVRLEDLKTAIENYLHPPTPEPIVPETKTVPQRGRKKNLKKA